MAIDILDTGHDALPELLFGCYPDVTQDRTCKLGEEALDEIEPGAVNRREGEFEAAGRASGEPASGLLRDMSGVIVENQLDRCASGIGGVKELEEFNELAAAVAVPDQGVNLPGKQINPGQQAERTMPFVLVIAGESRVDAGLGRQIGRGRGNRLDSWFFVIRDNGYWLGRFPRFGSLFQDLDLAVHAQNVRHLLLELGVATFQIIPHLVRPDFLLAKYFAHRPLRQIGEAFVPGGRRVLARMACQQPRRPQFMRITVILGLFASQRYQPRFRLRRNCRLLARARPVIQGGQRAIRKRPLDAALDSLVMHANPLPDTKERRCLTVRQRICARSTRRAASLRERAIAANISISSSVSANSTACRHPAILQLLVRSDTNEESTNESPV